MNRDIFNKIREEIIRLCTKKYLLHTKSDAYHNKMAFIVEGFNKGECWKKIFHVCQIKIRNIVSTKKHGITPLPVLLPPYLRSTHRSYNNGLILRQ